ncbi:hypothetical protein [Nocardioides panaciterrulae]|uniref:Uncharacterized protein n=1 Tax=Nocardioides panaciterrulae TaxID=661492 RepID=A0A7Y9E9G2_9ACTN|nr:hypothetical protein [Nocardioides panaciterrulae]NYD43661.1 hypothetical protein [Nocardioides panaciterrulae]
MASFDPFLGVAQLVDQVELLIDQAAIDHVKRTLDQNAGNVHHNNFKNLHVPPGAFGGNGAAAALGTNHLQAHEVIRATLQGVLDDLHAFRVGLDRAESLIQDADEGSAADLDRKRASDILTGLAGRDTASTRNHEARNQVLRGQGGASS